ncbi:MAG: alginate lyase family protein [Ectothiorhodospiraceae bacterium]|nr:alginate lyase family protein [Ectothiorhodospiraceae bacterium]
MEQEATGYKADIHFEPVALSPPLDWAENPFRDKSYATRLQSLQPADVYFFAFDETGDPRYLEPALAFALDWLDYHLVQDRKSYMRWADMPTGYRALKLARLADACLRGILPLTDAQLGLLVRGAEAHIAALVEPANLSQGNHGIFQMHGLCVLASVFWVADGASDGLAYGERGLEALIRKQFNAEGMHLEHSPQYHFFMQGYLDQLCASRWHAMLYYRDIQPRVHEATHWLLYPDRTMVRIGDTAVLSTMRPVGEQKVPDVETDCYRARVFPAGGLAIVEGRGARDGEFLYQMAAYHSKAHKHADHLHFEYGVAGKPLFTDSGAAGYKGGDDRAFLLSTRAHNTIQVDDVNYCRDGSDAFGSALRVVRAYREALVVESAVDHAALGVCHRRTVVLHPGRELRIEDAVECRDARQLTSWYHLADDIEIVRDGDALVLEREGVLVGRFIPGAGPDDELIAVRGAREPELQGWTAAGLGRLVARWTIGVRRHAATTRFVARFVHAGASGECILAADEPLLWRYEPTPGPLV